MIGMYLIVLPFHELVSQSIRHKRNKILIKYSNISDINYSISLAFFFLLTLSIQHAKFWFQQNSIQGKWSSLSWLCNHEISTYHCFLDFLYRKYRYRYSYGNLKCNKWMNHNHITPIVMGTKNNIPSAL